MNRTKHESIYGVLLGRIDSGAYPVGSQLPSEPRLALEFKVNRHTLRQALTSLAEAGLVSRTPGRGTVVLAVPGPASQSGRLKLVYRFFAETGDSLKSRVAEAVATTFMKAHPQVQVECAPIPMTGLLMAPTAPELMGAPHPTILRGAYVADYAKGDALLALDEFGDLVDTTSGLCDRLIYRTENGSGRRLLHALPVQFDTWMMFANASLIRRLGLKLPNHPMTWASFEKLCGQITAEGGGQGIRAIQFDLMFGRQTVTRFFPYFYSANGGRQLIDPETREARLSSDGNARFVEYLVRLYQKGYCHSEQKGHSFLDKKAAFLLSRPSCAMALYAARLPEEDITALPIPVVEKGVRACTVIRGEYAGILSNTLHNQPEKQAAWAFLKHLVSPEAQQMAYAIAGSFPVRPALGLALTEGDTGAAARFEYGIRHGIPTFDVAKNDEIHSIIRRVLMRALRGNCSAARALAEGQEMLEVYEPSRKGHDRDVDLKAALAM